MAMAVAPATPALYWKVTPWRSVIFSWNLPNADLYISTKPITDVEGMTPYAIPKQNLSLLWDTKYTYDPETDPAVISTDDTKGWNPFPDLNDGVWGDGATTANMTWSGGERHLTPTFEFDKAYQVSAVNLLVQASSNDPNSTSTVEIYAGPNAENLAQIKSTEVVLPREYKPLTIDVPTTLAKFVKIRVTTKDLGLNVGEIQIMGTNDYMTERRVEVTDLPIGGKYYAAVVANGKMATTQFTLPNVFEMGNLSEHFGLNVHMETFYGNMADVEKAARVLSEAGVKYVRWYAYGGHDRVESCLKKYGIGCYMLSYTPGIVAVGTGNEPELGKVTPKQVADNIRENRKNAKAANEKILIGGPTSMSSSFDYVDEVLKNLQPDELDFFDFHPYVASNVDPLPGLTRSVPENLGTLYTKWRALLKENGFGNKPIVASEFGFSSYDGNSWVLPVTLQGQASFLVRSYLGHIANGAALCIWYDFRNDGTDASNVEHNFGVVNNDLTPKPAYLAYQFMTKTLADKQFTGTIKNVTTPGFGYAFANSARTAYVYAFVNAMERSQITVNQPAKVLTLVDLYGKPLPLTSVGARTQFTVDGDPVYLLCAKPVTVVKAVSMPIPPKEEVTVKAPQKMLTVCYPNKAVLEMQVANTFKKAMPVTVTVDSAAFAQQVTRKLSLKAGAKETVNIDVPLKANETAVYPVKLVAKSTSGTIENEIALYCVKQTAGATTYTTDINRDGKQEVVLENENLHVLIFPNAGSRIFRIIDKRTGQDQLFIPPVTKAGLADISVNPAAGEYLSNGTFGGVFYGAPYEAKTFANDTAIGMEATTTLKEGYQVVHRVEIPRANPEAVTQSYVITNTSNEKRILDLNTHPQYTPGGKLEFGKVDISIPSDKQIKGNAFMSFRGDVGTTTPDQGWWKAVNTLNGYTVRCEFEIEKATGVRQWHDGEFFNMELYFKRVELAPGQSTSLTYTLFFSPNGK